MKDIWHGKSILLSLPLLATLLALVGCGGGGASSGGAAISAMRLSVDWPTPSSGDAEAARMVVTVAEEGRIVGQATLDRAAGAAHGEAAIPDLPPGEATTTATAYGSTGGSVATAQATAHLRAGHTLLQSVSMPAESSLAVETTGEVSGTGSLVVTMH